MIEKSEKAKRIQISKTAQIAKAVFKPLDPDKQKILKIVFERDEISLQDLATELGLSTDAIGRRLKPLQDEGLILKFKKPKNNKGFVKWVGGVPTIEAELLSSTNRHVAASLLAESYDSLIMDAFSIFTLLFEDQYWEILMNLKEGMTDVELGNRLGNAFNLDSIRRVLVTCNAHNLLKLNNIRDPADKDIIKIFEPLYRIESVNKEFTEYFVLIRGLASAVQYRISGEKTQGYSHLYNEMLDKDIQLFFQMKETIFSKASGKELELLNKLLFNYEMAPDLDRIYKNENWRLDLKQTKYLKLETNDRLIISDNFYK